MTQSSQAQNHAESGSSVKNQTNDDQTGTETSDEVKTIAVDSKIAFIGCGNMAKAVIAGLVKSGWSATNIMASNPTLQKLEQVQADYGCQITQDNQKAADFADILVFAVKPQKLANVCRLLAPTQLDSKLIISVAAGFTTELINQHLSQSLPIVRAMPNTPALIGKGATGLYATPQVSKQQQQLAEKIFQAVGTITWVEKESQINMVTAIAGSSPAYIFLLMQAMIEQAQTAGLSQQAAFELISQSVAGAARLAQATPEKDLATLRKEVTSPGGTTAAAINSFKNNDFESTVRQAVDAAFKRGIELGQID